MREKNYSTLLYTSLIACAGIVLGTVLCVLSVGTSPSLSWFAIGCLVVALVISELLPAAIESRTKQVGVASVSSAFAFALMMFAPIGIVLIAIVFSSFVEKAVVRRRKRFLFFNIGQFIVSISAAQWVYSLLVGRPFIGASLVSAGELHAVLLSCATYISVNNVLVIIAFALNQREPIVQFSIKVLRPHFYMQLLELAMMPLAIVIMQFSEWLLPTIFLPLAIVIRAMRLSAERENATFRDALTGLANRAYAEESFQSMVNKFSEGRIDSQAGVLVLGIDRFYEITGTLGHAAADELLVQAGKRLSSQVRESIDCVARLNGEFFAVTTPINGASDFTVLAERLLECLSEDFILNEVRVSLQATAGAAVYPQHGVNAQVLLSRAENTLRSAIEGGGGRLHVYDPTQEASTPARLAMLGELRAALDNGQIEVFYQPKVASVSGMVTGVEALVRWRHPTRGLVPPMEFIPLAETTGLIAPLTWNVLDQTLAQTRRWMEDHGWAIGVAVNLAATQLMDDETPARVVSALADHGVPAHMLTLEVTESTLIQDAEKAFEVLAKLRYIGVRISVDDYGTGYSSMAYLHSLSVDELKIDREFIKNLAVEGNRHDLAIVETTIDLGHRLMLTVVAEGVETTAELEILRDAGCDVIQGFYYAPPRPAKVITEWLTAQVVPQVSGPLPLPAGEYVETLNQVCDICHQPFNLMGKPHRSDLCVPAEV